MMNTGITFKLWGNDVWIHEEVVNAIIVVLILSVFYIYLGHRIKKANPLEKPKGIVLIAEIIYSTIDGLVLDNMGEHNRKFTPYMITLVSFLGLSNIIGLFGLKPPTSDYNVTLTMALITAFMIQYYKVKNKGFFGYIKSFFEPMPLMLPMNIIDVFSVPVSMSMRLFGNIMSGVLIMTLIYSFLGSVFVPLIPAIAPFFHFYFDLFAGFLQAFVFLMLTMVFVGEANSPE